MVEDTGARRALLPDGGSRLEGMTVFPQKAAPQIYIAGLLRFSTQCMKEPTFVAKIFDVFATKTLASLFGLKEFVVVKWGRSDMHDSNLFSIFSETLKLTATCA